MQDIDLTSPDEVSVKLRRASDNAKVPRRPYNLQVAIQALVQEYCDINGPEDAAHHLIPAIVHVIARDKGLSADNEAQVIVGVAQLTATLLAMLRRKR